MHRSKTLPEYLLHFFRYLRDLQFLIGIKEMTDAYKAVEAIDISNLEQFKLALKIVLVSSKEEEEQFEQAFYQFFIKKLREEDKQDLLHFHSEEEIEHLLENLENENENFQGEKQTTGSEDENRAGGHQKVVEKPDVASGIITNISPVGDDDVGDYSTVPLWSATRGSARKGRNLQVKISTTQLSAMEKTAKKLTRQINLKQARRSKVKTKGNVLHLQHTLRKSFRTATEPFELVMKGPRKQKANYVLLCDTSRSMAATVDHFLQFAFALTKLNDSVEVFLFSTKLTKVTEQFYSADEATPTLEIHAEEWGDGTCIGESLHAFVENYAVKVLRKDTVVIIASDGLDAGDIDFLQGSMNEIAIRSAGVIWVNPLLAIEGYEPTARAMEISLPYIKHFFSLEDFEAFDKKF